MDANFLRENALFWSLLGFCYDPPIPDETGAPRLFDHNFRRYTQYHDDFSDAGVDIHTLILHAGWVGVDKYDYSVCDKVLEGLFASGKTKYAIPRIKLNVPVDWCAKYPEEVWVYDKGPRDAESIKALVGTLQHDWLGYDSPDGYFLDNAWRDPRPNVGGLISMQSFSSQQWIHDAGVALTNLIRHIEDGPYGDKIIGYHIAYGISGELMPWGRNTGGYGDFGISNQKHFLNWGIEKYGSLEKVREAWGEFGDDVVPPKAIAEPQELGKLSKTDSTWGMDYMRYFSEVNTGALMALSKVAKQASGGKLVGAFYGYVLDVIRCAYAGHLGWDRVLKCPDIDFFAAPKSYRQCGPGMPGGEMCPSASVNLHKLWLDEVDNRTHRSNEMRLFPAENMEQTHTVHWREWAKNMSHDSGLWFMDLGIGWFDEKGIMDNIAKIVRANKRVRQILHKSVAQVLYVIDQESKLALPYDLTRAASDTLRNWQRCGVPIDNILTDDLLNVPLENVKLVVFSSAHALSAEKLTKIRKALPKDCRIVWQGQTPFEMEQPEKSDILLPLGLTPEELREIVEENGVHTYAPLHCAVYADNRVIGFFPCPDAMQLTADLGAEYDVFDPVNEKELGRHRYLQLDIPAKGYAVFELR